MIIVPRSGVTVPPADVQELKTSRRAQFLGARAWPVNVPTALRAALRSACAAVFSTDAVRAADSEIAMFAEMANKLMSEARKDASVGVVTRTVRFDRAPRIGDYTSPEGRAFESRASEALVSLTGMTVNVRLTAGEPYGDIPQLDPTLQAVCTAARVRIIEELSAHAACAIGEAIKTSAPPHIAFIAQIVGDTQLPCARPSAPGEIAALAFEDAAFRDALFACIKARVAPMGVSAALHQVNAYGEVAVRLSTL